MSSITPTEDPDFEDESPIESSTNSADADAILLPTPIPSSQPVSKLETSNWKLSSPLIPSTEVPKSGQISYHKLPRSSDAEDAISNTTGPKAPPATEPSVKEPSAAELPATEPSATEPSATQRRFVNSIKLSVRPSKDKGSFSSVTRNRNQKSDPPTLLDCYKTCTPHLDRNKVQKA